MDIDEPKLAFDDLQITHFLQTLQSNFAGDTPYILLYARDEENEGKVEELPEVLKQNLFADTLQFSKEEEERKKKQSSQVTFDQYRDLMKAVYDFDYQQFKKGPGGWDGGFGPGFGGYGGGGMDHGGGPGVC